jgi:signal transduction histidine kinase
VLEHVQSAKMLTADNAQQQRRLRDLEGYLEGPAARVAEANPRIEALENTERTLLVARHRIDDLWGEGLLTAFLVLLITATAVLTWLCRRIRKEMAERKRQTAALDKANLGLEAANRELESFSYSVSHDLRSPLRAIDGYSQMLEEDYGTQLDDTGRRYIRTVRGGSQRMAALIDDLLTFSRLSRQSLNRQTVDMTALARRAAAEVLEGQPEPKPAVRIAELPPVAGDPALLRQVWTNLIGNAVKYSSKAATPQVKMPKIDGIEVLKRLKADARTRSIPVVMLTSSKEETDLVRSYDLGVNSYLVKPVDFKRFSEEVTRVGYYWVAMNQTPGN